MTCLILACCRCDRVPALLFIRPYGSRRRWNNHEEIELVDPPAADAIPQWPLDIFIDATEVPSHGKTVASENSRERVLSLADAGFPSMAAPGFPWRLFPSVEYLCQKNIISIEQDEESFFFRMVDSIREEIWEQTSTQDRLLLWFDLLKLIIYSSPDVYAESFWKSIFNAFKPVIDSTLLPFISVLEWTHVQYHQAV